MSDKVVLVDVADGVMTITLNRPEAKNAVNKALAEGVAAAIDQLEGDSQLRAAVITGAGGTFCSGMDLKAFVSGEVPMVEGRGFAGLCEYVGTKPLIAAVEGYALAGGFEVAISCDLIVAADNARFGIPEVKRGLTAAAGGLAKLPRQIPPRIAMELALTGDFISTQRAFDLGLINQVVPAGTALEAARALATRIAANGPLAVADLFPVRIMPLAAWRNLKLKTTDITLLYQCDPPPRSVEEVAGVYGQALEQVAAGRRLVVVGHCIAGPVALELPAGGGCSRSRVGLRRRRGRGGGRSCARTGLNQRNHRAHRHRVALLRDIGTHHARNGGGDLNRDLVGL